MKSKIIAAIAAILVFGPFAANATLIGQTVTCDIGQSFGDEFLSCDSDSAVVGAGTEFTVFTSRRATGAFIANLFTIDIDDQSVAITSPQFGYFGTAQLTLGELFWAGANSGSIIGIENFMSVGDSTVIQGASNVSLGSPNSLIIDLFLVLARDANTTSFDLIVDHGPPVTVPEPGTLALLGIGLASMGLARRRRKV